jgi:isochorismate pyruvate lyase
MSAVLKTVPASSAQAGPVPAAVAALEAAPLPDQCKTMQDVRTGVDRVDAALVALLAQRFGYMEAAARIKSDRATVRDEARKAQVIANAAAQAAQLGVPASVVATLWEQLVEASIAYEFRQFDRLNLTDSAEFDSA